MTPLQRALEQVITTNRELVEKAVAAERRRCAKFVRSRICGPGYPGSWSAILKELAEEIERPTSSGDGVAPEVV